MASLVADYGSSSIENSDEDDTPQTSVDDEDPQDHSHHKSRNFLTGEVSSDDDDDNDEERQTTPDHNCSMSTTDGVECPEKLPNPMVNCQKVLKLPAPLLGHMTGTPPPKVENSVFVNPFQRNEEEKLLVLEKHVKMTVAETTEKNSKHSQTKKKKVCYSFKKGSCRFGSKCRFSHDLEGEPRVGADGDSGDSGQSIVNQKFTQFQNYGQGSFNAACTEQPVDEDDVPRMKKKRIGVSDHLMPPQKAMRALDEQRVKERPWTLPH